MWVSGQTYVYDFIDMQKNPLLNSVIPYSTINYQVIPPTADTVEKALNEIDDLLIPPPTEVFNILHAQDLTGKLKWAEPTGIKLYPYHTYGSNYPGQSLRMIQNNNLLYIQNCDMFNDITMQSQQNGNPTIHYASIGTNDFGANIIMDGNCTLSMYRKFAGNYITLNGPNNTTDCDIQTGGILTLASLKCSRETPLSCSKNGTVQKSSYPVLQTDTKIVTLSEASSVFTIYNTQLSDADYIDLREELISIDVTYQLPSTTTFARLRFDTELVRHDDRITFDSISLLPVGTRLRFYCIFRMT